MVDPTMAIATIPAVVGLTEVAKRLNIPASVAPLVAVAVGVAVQLLSMLAATNPIAAGVANGITLGLAAAGLWDVSKRTAPDTTTIVDQSGTVRSA